MTLLLSFWGKGGVGKSTLSAATAALLADKGLSVAVVSTDLVPSIGLLLCGRVVAGRGLVECSGVHVWEAREEDVLRLWRERFGEEVYHVVSSFLPVGREIVDYVAGAPGIPDQFMLYTVYRLVKRGEYDIVVWDTTAAGGTLRLLRIEEEVYQHLGEAARLYLRTRSLLNRLRQRSDSGGDALRLIEEWRSLARDILDMLASSRHRLALVASPTRVAVEATKLLAKELSLHSVKPRIIAVNMFATSIPGCEECPPYQYTARTQGELVRELEKIAPVVEIPLIEKPPSTRDDLKKLEPYIDALLKGLGVA